MSTPSPAAGRPTAGSLPPRRPFQGGRFDKPVLPQDKIDALIRRARDNAKRLMLDALQKTDPKYRSFIVPIGQWKKVGQNLEFCHFRDALREAIQLARLGNQYFDAKAPWDLVRKDRGACGTALHVALRASRALALLMAPFTPFSSQTLWASLGYDTDVHVQRWDAALEDLPEGQRLRVGKPLFEKIELEPVSEADRFDLRVGQIVDVQDHPNADKLYVIQVDLGDEVRTLVAGMKANYTKEQMLGKRVAVLCNLEPAKLRGVQSNGMVLAAEDERDVGLLLPPEDAPLGTQILGVRGAPRLTFSEFHKFAIRVVEGNRVELLGADGKTRTLLRVGDRYVLVDKGFPPGSHVR